MKQENSETVGESLFDISSGLSDLKNLVQSGTPYCVSCMIICVVFGKADFIAQGFC